MNGYDTEIFEMHSQAGGLCEAWKRKDYLLDGCIHWFCGCNPSRYLYKVWNGLINMTNFPMAVYDEFCSVEHRGKRIRFYADIEKLNKELKSISPEDGPAINKFTATIKRFDSFQAFGEEAENVTGITGKIAMAVKMTPLIFAFMKWKMPIEKYARRFKSEQIRNFLITSLGKKTPAWILFINSCWFNNKDAGYPTGGAISGREVTRMICKLDNKQFKTMPF